MLPRIAVICGEVTTTKSNATVSGSICAQHVASFIQKQLVSPTNSLKNKKMKGLMDHQRLEKDMIVISNDAKERCKHVEERLVVQGTKHIQHTKGHDIEQHEREALQQLVSLSSGVTFDLAGNLHNNSEDNSPHDTPSHSKSSPDGGSRNGSTAVSLSSIFDAYVEKKKSTSSTLGLTDNLLRSFPSSSSQPQDHETDPEKNKHHRKKESKNHQIALVVHKRRKGGSHDNGNDIAVRPSRKSSTSSSFSPDHSSSNSSQPTRLPSPSLTVPSSDISTSCHPITTSTSTPTTINNPTVLSNSVVVSRPVLSTCTRNNQNEYLGVGLSLLSVDPDSMEDELSIRVINSTPYRHQPQPSSPASPALPSSPASPPPPHLSHRHSHSHHVNQGTVTETGIVPRSPPPSSPSTRARILASHVVPSTTDPMGGYSQSHASTVVGSTMAVPIVTGSTMAVPTMTVPTVSGSSMVGSTVVGSTVTVPTVSGSTMTVSTMGLKGLELDELDRKPMNHDVEGRRSHRRLVTSPVNHDDTTSNSSNNGSSNSGSSSSGGNSSGGNRARIDASIDKLSRGMMTLSSSIIDTREERIRQALVHEKTCYISSDDKRNYEIGLNHSLPRNNGSDCLPSQIIHEITCCQPSNHEATSMSTDISLPNNHNNNYNHNHNNDSNNLLNSFIQEFGHDDGDSFLISRQVTIDRQMTIDDSIMSPLLQRDYDHHHFNNDQQKSLLASLSHHGTAAATTTTAAGDGREGTTVGGEGRGGGGGLGHLPSGNSTDSLDSDWSRHTNRQMFPRPIYHQISSGLHENVHQTRLSHNSLLLLTTGPTSQHNTTTVTIPSTTGGNVIQSLLVQPTPMHPPTGPPILVQPIPIRPSSLPLASSIVQSLSTHVSSATTIPYPIKPSTSSTSSPLLPSSRVAPAVPTTLGKSFQSPRSKRSNFVEAN